MSDRNDELNQAFLTLKNALKKANLEVLKNDEFNVSRELTGVMEQLSRLQKHSLKLLCAERTVTHPEPLVPRPAPVLKDAHFPRFFRSGDILYKEGLRQDRASVYIQKVDRSAFEEITASILSQNRKFKPAKLIKDSAYPSYQIYILLNVMQDVGLVENPERGMYRLSPRAKEFDSDGFWQTIEERRTD